MKGTDQVANWRLGSNACVSLGGIELIRAGCVVALTGPEPFMAQNLANKIPKHHSPPLSMGADTYGFLDAVSKQELEAECLSAARTAEGCADLERVRIKGLYGNDPFYTTWVPVAFYPVLPQNIVMNAIDKVLPLREKFQLKMVNETFV
jgi:hypothetical protein